MLTNEKTNMENQVPQSKNPESKESKLIIITGEFVISLSPTLRIPDNSVVVQICSATEVNTVTKKGKVGEKTSLKRGSNKKKMGKRIVTYTRNFRVNSEFGTPGAFLITNKHKHKIFLESAALYIPKQDPSFDGEYEVIHFYCGSWIYPIKLTVDPRVFFSNTCYLPKETPSGLSRWRSKELENLRGDGSGERKEWERIYDYDVYNDLGNPDKSDQHIRPVLGASESYPYPRRLRTGRPPSVKDPSSESRPELINLDVYVPPDERLSPKRVSELMLCVVQATALIPEPESAKNSSRTFKDLKQLQSELISDKDKNKAMPKWVRKQLKQIVSRKLYQLMKTQTRQHKPHKKCLIIPSLVKQQPNRFPTPQLLPRELTESELESELESESESESESEYYLDEDDFEFGRQMLAGTNPVRIRISENVSMQETPHRDRQENLESDTVKDETEAEAILVLDHHDYLIPYLSKINGDKHGHGGIYAYASRTILKLYDDTLVPTEIQLTNGDPDSVHRFLPLHTDRDELTWKLAKAHVAANDSAYHQLITHWLHTHAVVEPFIIATRRQLSVVHPIHRLLDPHFKHTMHINALARTFVINSGGIFENILFTGKFSMELSSQLYKEWRFEEQALPTDLVKRGMASNVSGGEDSKSDLQLFSNLSRIVQTLKSMAFWLAVELGKLNSSCNCEGKLWEELLQEVSFIPVRAATGIEKDPYSVHNLTKLFIEKPSSAATIVDKIKKDPSLSKLFAKSIRKNPYIMAKLEENARQKYPRLELKVEDYPYAVDGLEIWRAIQMWVADFCCIFYEDDSSVESDEEIQAWWKEIREVGHGDKEWGSQMIKGRSDLIQTLTTLIWIASAFHAAINFGQYAYAGYPPNRPTLCRKPIPKEGTEEYKTLEEAPEKYYLETLPDKFQMALTVALMEVLSRHASDQVYLGQRSSPKWTDSQLALAAFAEFQQRLGDIQEKISERNKNIQLANRFGPAGMTYTLLYPDTFNHASKAYISGKGIPSSISI